MNNLLAWVSGIISYVCVFVMIYTSQPSWLIFAIAAWLTAAVSVIHQERGFCAECRNRSESGDAVD